MEPTRPYATALQRLRGAGLRPTRQRLALARQLLEAGDRHVTAEQVHEEVRKSGISISLATVYNTLHQFTDAGLMREVLVEPGRSYFDTNTAHHYHFYHHETGLLQDIPQDQLAVARLPTAPAGTSIDRVDVIVRVKPRR